VDGDLQGLSSLARSVQFCFVLLGDETDGEAAAHLRRFAVEALGEDFHLLVCSPQVILQLEDLLLHALPLLPLLLTQPAAMRWDSANIRSFAMVHHR